MFDLSVRAYNCCLFSSIEDSEALLKCYYSKGSFRFLRNCGKRTNKELCEVSENLSKLVGDIGSQKSADDSNKPENKVQDFYLDWNLDIISQKYSLSVRSKNCLQSSGINSSREIIDHFLTNNSFIRLRNCGKKTNDELIEMSKKLLNDSSYSSIVNQEMTPDNSKLASAILLGSNDNYKSIYDDYSNLSAYLNRNYKLTLNYEENKFLMVSILEKSLKIFKLLDLMIKAVLSERDYNVVWLRCFSNNLEIPTLQELGEKFSITRERVRQIEQSKSKLVFLKIERFFVVNKYIQTYLDHEYYFPRAILKIPDGLLDSIRNSENVYFNNTFITRVIANINNYGYFFHEKDCFLIHKDFSFFNLKKFISDVNSVISKKVSKAYVLDLDLLIKKYSKKASYSKMNEVKPIIKHILADAFGLFVEENNTIIFKKSDYKILPEFIENILSENKRAMHFKEIAEALNSKYPGIANSYSVLKSLLYRNSNIIPIGRTNTFALKSLEKENLKFKGGTIRDIVYEFLKKSDKKIHINEIAKHVKKFRKTNKYSINTSLKADNSKRFIAIYGGYFTINK